MIDWLENIQLPSDWLTKTVGESYGFTHKPRTLRISDYDKVPFVPMDLVPVMGASRISWIEKGPDEIASGTYFERGDVLVSRITPSFENGKQGIANDLPTPFGYGSTELIPIQAQPGKSDAYFLFYLLLHPILRSQIASKMEGSTGRQRVPESLIRDLVIPFPPVDEQRRIAAVLSKVQAAVETESNIGRVARELKQAALVRLLSRGIRGGKQKQTEVGLIPIGWALDRLEECCSVVNSSMAYSELLDRDENTSKDAVECMGVKVSDMNLDGNEICFKTANLQRKIDQAEAIRRTVPDGTIVFPKRGAAIATNKKRMTTAWTVLDPNLIGVRAGERLLPWFLFQWFQQFDLRTITEPGPTPQLNKKNLTPLLLPVPPMSEQREIVDILATLDAKISHHDAKQALLREMFMTLLDDLLTARRRVSSMDPALLQP